MLIKSKDTTVTSFFSFALLCASIFWIPGSYIQLKTFIVGIILLTLFFPVAYFHLKENNLRLYQLLIVFYVGCIAVSFIFHFLALMDLSPATIITVGKKTVSHGLRYAMGSSILFVLFPVFILVLVYFFKKAVNPESLLLAIPIFLTPSVIVALLQFFFQPDFLDFMGSKGSGISGLGTDRNGFGISLFLSLPFCILALVTSRPKAHKIYFSFFLFFGLLCLLLSGVRSAAMGIALFSVLLLSLISYVLEDQRMIGRLRWSFSLIILVIVVLSVVYKDSTYRNESTHQTTYDRLLFSMQDLSRADYASFLNSRLNLWVQAGRLIGEASHSGWGPGGYTRNLQNVRFRNGESPAYFDNPLNHYFQLFCELGISGLVMNLALHLIPLAMIFHFRKSFGDIRQRWAILLVSVTLIVMMILYLTNHHAMFMDVVWIIAIMISYLLVIVMSRTDLELRLCSHWNYFVFFLFMGYVFFIPFIIGTYETTFGTKGYRSIMAAPWWPYLYERNAYPEEIIDGNRVRWCEKNARIQIGVKKQAFPQKVTLYLKVPHGDAENSPVHVFYGGRALSEEILIGDQSWRKVTLDVTKDDFFVFRTPTGRIWRYLILSFDVNRTDYKPGWLWERSKNLGLAVRIPKI